MLVWARSAWSDIELGPSGRLDRKPVRRAAKGSMTTAEAIAAAAAPGEEGGQRDTAQLHGGMI